MFIELFKSIRIARLWKLVGIKIVTEMATLVWPINAALVGIVCVLLSEGFHRLTGLGIKGKSSAVDQSEFRAPIEIPKIKLLKISQDS